ncbi:nicotinamide riboside transporter PnuC [Francisellaceae bacterium CB299]|jgi:nicotinamide mononucleotide transporter
MHHFYEWLIRPYHDYDTYMIYLEIIAATTGVVSVYYSYKRNILVYIFGFISSLIYVFLLYDWELFGDMLLNSYYLLANLFGFVIWAKHLESESKIKVYIEYANKRKLKKALYIFLITMISTPFLYAHQKNLSVIELPTYSYVDSFVTAVSFAGVYLMIKRCIESWYLWAIADIISIPLFLYKGYGITAIQYTVFLVLVWLGWREWRAKLNVQSQECVI